MELLIVGAGAVGSVYGYFASRHSSKTVRVTYLVKPSHRRDLEDGLQLYWWKARSAENIQFKDFTLIDTLDEVAKRKFDAVLITLPSDKFRAEGWIESLLAALNSHSPQVKIWSLQPGATDQEFLLSKMSPGGSDRIVKGIIPIISYLAPLPGESFPKPGYAFYIPPFTKAQWVASNENAAREVSDFFNAGGLNSKVSKVTKSAAVLMPEALLRSVVAGLERSGWSIDRFLNNENIHLASGSTREILAIQSDQPAQPWWLKLASGPRAIQSAIRISQKMMPFDFESYMRAHFTKVDRQMHMQLDEVIAAGKKLKKSTTSLELLRGKQKR